MGINETELGDGSVSFLGTDFGNWPSQVTWAFEKITKIEKQKTWNSAIKTSWISQEFCIYECWKVWTLEIENWGRNWTLLKQLERHYLKITRKLLANYSHFEKTACLGEKTSRKLGINETKLVDRSVSFLGNRFENYL